jgi:hypothetical protein
VKSDQKSIADYVCDLADKNGVTAEKLPLDVWAEKVNELSDSESATDETVQLIINLRRVNVISLDESNTLILDYIQEKKGTNYHGF